MAPRDRRLPLIVYVAVVARKQREGEPVAPAMLVQQQRAAPEHRIVDPRKRPL
jgi:hypothetical protein